MDPRGQVQDLQTLRKLGENIEPCLSPEVCFDLVKDLNATKGKGESYKLSWINVKQLIFNDLFFKVLHCLQKGVKGLKIG